MAYFWSFAIAIAMAMAAAAAVAAAAVIRPEHAEGARNHENQRFIKKCVFRFVLVIICHNGPIGASGGCQAAALNRSLKF